MNKALLHFYERRAKMSDLNDLTSEEIALFGGLAYICNELNVFSILLGLSKEPNSDSKPVVFASRLQHNVMLRTLSSKVFEAHEFLKETIKSAKNIDSEIMHRLVTSEAEIDRLTLSSGRAVNMNIRNEVSFHYKFKVAKRNTKNLPEDADSSIYVNELDGNSYFVFGESLMFFERISRISKSDKKFGAPEKLAKEWLQWSLETVQLIKKLQAEVFDLVSDRLGGGFCKTHYFVDQNLVADEGEATLPVFIRGSCL